MDQTGKIQWKYCYGGSYNEEPCAILQTEGGGYFVAGYSSSNDGDVTGHHGQVYRTPNSWVIKLNESGKLIGEESLPGSMGSPQSACFSNQGGFIVAGIGGSFPHHGIYEHGDGDFCLMKLSKRGIVDTACSMGGSGNDVAFSINQTKDRGYIMAGQTLAGNGDVTGFHGEFDYWVTKLDSNLKLQWEEALGGSSGDIAYSIHQTADGGYIIAGESDSYNGQVTPPTYGNWIVKLAPDNTPAAITSNETVTAQQNTVNQLSISPNPANDWINVSFPFSNNIITFSGLYGRELQHFKIENRNSTEMNIHSLQVGFYIVSVKDEKGNVIASEKLFKQ